MMRCLAHDQDLADRIRRLVAWEDDIVERQMRGGLAFLVKQQGCEEDRQAG